MYVCMELGKGRWGGFFFFCGFELCEVVWDEEEEEEER